MANQETLPVAVRTATAADVDLLVPLYRGFMLHLRVEPPESSELARRLERLLDSDSDEVLVALLDGGRAAGYLQQRYFWSVWRPARDGYIEDLFVAPELRGQGVGTRLLLAGFERARERGVGRIALETNERNTHARRLYERLGFENMTVAWEGGRQLCYWALL